MSGLDLRSSRCINVRLYNWQTFACHGASSKNHLADFFSWVRVGSDLDTYYKWTAASIVEFCARSCLSAPL